MKLNEIGRPSGNRRPKGRKGRGPGSGNGKTAGRGTKGQKSRSGAKIPAWFEGGQMPINRRLPKRGFKNIFAKHYQIVNLRDLDRLGEVTAVDAKTLAEHGIVSSGTAMVKLLGMGEVGKAYTVAVDKISKSAQVAIEAAGGKVEIKPEKPKKAKA